MRPGSGTAARMLRLGAWTAAALVGLVLFVAVGTPLIMRGPVLAHLVDDLTEGRCGSVTLEGGHFGLNVVPALILQRPFDVVLRGAQILEPDGEVLFRARSVKGRMSVLRHPWRVAVEQVSLADGTWRLANSRLGERITIAFSKVPPAGRSECRKSAPRPERTPRLAELLDARRVTLRNISIVLSFPSWGATLDATDAQGTLKARMIGTDIQFIFDLWEVDARRGGSLRIGRRDVPLTPVVPFDRVRINRVAVTEAEPRDLWLDVSEARTANAVLSGSALFTKAFVPKPRRLPAGMNLDAQWTAIGQALARTPHWAPVGQRLARLDAGLNTSLRGPYKALTGSATVAGRGVVMDATLLPHRRYRVGVALHDLATAPLLPRAWRDAMAGRLDGRILVKAQLGRKPRDASVAVNTLELDLRRAGHAGGPRRVIIGRAAGPSSAAALRVGIGALTLENQVLRVGPIRVVSPGVDLATKLRVERLGSSRTLRFEARTAPESRVTVRGEAFRPPGLLRVRLAPGRALAVEPFSVRHVGGGAIDASGSVRFGGPVALRAAIHDYPLARIPGAAKLRALRGQLNASFATAGSTSRPCLSGAVALTGVGWAELPLGEGRVAFRCIPGGARFEGHLIEGLAIRGQVWGLLRDPHAMAEARFDSLSVSSPSSPVGSVQVDGPLRIDDRRIVVGPLSARLGAGGWLEVGGTHGPGRLTLTPRQGPLPAKDVDLTVRGGGLSTTRPIAGFSVRDLALDVRLAQAGQNWRLSGDVNVGHGAFELTKMQKKNESPAGGARDKARSGGVLEHIWADLHVTGPRDAIEVGVPYAPDATIGVDCRIQGPLSSPRIAGKVEGDGLYSRMMLAMADRFTAREIRSCDLRPR